MDVIKWTCLKEKFDYYDKERMKHIVSRILKKICKLHYSKFQSSFQCLVLLLLNSTAR
jgi:hypothetical protein